MYINDSRGIGIKNFRVEPVKEDGTALDPHSKCDQCIT